MKIKCINIYNEHTKQQQDISHWLKIGNEYIVLEVLISPEKKIHYRLVGENQDKMPALYDAKQFITTSNEIPSSWIVTQSPNGVILFSPRPWQSLGFWEECYDCEPKALEIYKAEAKKIYEESQ